MAEALSVAASGIAVAQVAIQVGQSIVKLKQLCDDFQDVPSSIADLLEQVDCLDPALWEAESTFKQANLPPMFWDDSIANRSTTYCRKALNALTEVVDELAILVNGTKRRKSSLARVKVILKKEQLRTLERRLQNAVRMLSLAQQSYLVALTRVQPDIIIQRFLAITNPLVSQKSSNALHSDPHEVSDVPRQQHCSRPTTLPLSDKPGYEALALRRPRSREHTVSRYHLRLPIWLSRSTWELQSVRSYGNWKFNLRCYNNRPRESVVFKIAQFGTVNDLRELFTKGVASPYDRDARWNYTLLHFAMDHLNKPMVEYLLDIGLSPSERNALQDTPMASALWLTVHGDRETKFLEDWPSMAKFEELSDLGDNQISCYSEVGGIQCSCYHSAVSSGLYKLFRALECPWHERTTLDSRLAAIRRAVYRPRRIQPAVLSDILHPYWSENFQALCTYSTVSFSLIHTVAWGLGAAFADTTKYDFRNDKPTWPEWVNLAEKVINYASNIHIVEKIRPYEQPVPHAKMTAKQISTPLTTVIESCIATTGRRNVLIAIPGLLKLWLLTIQSSGHDLREYGRRENELLQDKNLRINRDFEYWYLTRQGRYKTRIIYLRGFIFGPEPEDWGTLWSYPEKSYAADFWRLVEDPSHLMPGTWVEDSDDDEEIWI